MKKILIPIDGSLRSEVAVDYAVQLSQEESNLLVGVYIQDLIYEYIPADETNSYTKPSPYPFTTPYTFPSEPQLIDYKVVRDEQRNEYKEHFVRKCEDAKISYKVHSDEGILSSELIKESSFADLIIVGFDSYYAGIDGKSRISFFKEILKNAHCPVLLVPRFFKKAENIILTYDNRESSLYAMKQFFYLFPLIGKKIKTQLISVVKSESEIIENESLLEELSEAHFPNINIKKLVGEADVEIFRFLKNFDNPLLVMGAFGRNKLSQLINPSVGEEILNWGNFPLFVAHK